MPLLMFLLTLADYNRCIGEQRDACLIQAQSEITVCSGEYSCTQWVWRNEQACELAATRLCLPLLEEGDE